MPLTVKRFTRGIAPTGVLENSATVMTTSSPMPTPSHAASSRPSRMLKLPGSRDSSSPSSILSPITDTVRSSAATTPRTIAGCWRGPLSRASFSTYGAAPATRGSVSARSTARCQPTTGSPQALTVACAAICSMRSRISVWKPLITASVVMSAATPSAMPRMEASEMKEMKPLRRLARR